MAAAEGNNYSSKDNRLWSNTLRRAAVQDPERLRRIAERLLADAEAGDAQAIRELGDRLDGKPQQTTDVTVRTGLAEVLSSFGQTSRSPGDDTPVA